MSADTEKPTCPRCHTELDIGVANGICPACLLKQAALDTGTDSIPSIPWEPPSVEEIAAAFPQLEIVELIGHGGMGAVYKARQKSLSRLVALKILAPHYADNPDFAERFSREGQALAEVNHPNIVTVHDFGRADEFYFLLMEFVDGVNLRKAMAAGRFTPEQALAIVPPICEALQFAHNRGIVHRDIKPENLLLDKDGKIRIADFGIARMLRPQNAANDVPLNSSAAVEVVAANAPPELTQESVLGTPQYMAPEQRDDPTLVDHRADIYSLGVVLYEMLTGELPGARLQPPSREVQVDVRLDEIVLRALEKQPALRYQSASEFQTQLTTLTATSSPQKQSSISQESPSLQQAVATTEIGTQSKREEPLFTLRQRGLGLVAIGLFFTLMFLIGGGVVDSTNGSYWTRLFLVIYFVGLVFPGILVFFSTVASVKETPAAPRPVTRKDLFVRWIALTAMLSGAIMMPEFFRSDLFGSPAGQHLFIVGMGLALAQLPPLGLALIRRAYLNDNDSFSNRSTMAAMCAMLVVACLILLAGFGWQRIHASAEIPAAILLTALIAGTVVGAVAWKKLKQRENAVAKSERKWQLSTAVVLATVVSLVFGVSQLLAMFRMTGTVSATAFVESSVQDGHLNIRHNVTCPEGWDVWVTVENAQLFMADESTAEPVTPKVISRYQAKLTPRGRVRIPLEFLPTTDAKREDMRTSMGPSAGWEMLLSPKRDVNILAYTTESLMRVWAVATILPEGQNPNTQRPIEVADAPPFQTIEPPALTAFEGQYNQGKVELVGLRPHPSDGQSAWKPNGELLTPDDLPESSGRSSAAGRIIRDIVVFVHSDTNQPSQPVMKFEPPADVSGMGSSFDKQNKDASVWAQIRRIACRPEAQHIDIEVGVADGEWRSMLSFKRHENQQQYGASYSGGTAGSWEGSARTVNASGETVPLSFRYSQRDDFETRLVYERSDGTIVKLRGQGSETSHGLINSLTTLPVEEFKTIRRFHVLARPYQWVEFRNVSLQPDVRSSVDVESVGIPKSVLAAFDEGKVLEPAVTQTPTVKSAPDKDDTDTDDELRQEQERLVAQLIRNEAFVKGFRVRTTTKIRQRVGDAADAPEIKREIETLFAIDENGRIRSEQSGGVPGKYGTTEVRQENKVAVYDGVIVTLGRGQPGGEFTWGYRGRDKSRIPREVDPRNYLLQHSNESIRQKIIGGQYDVTGYETYQGRRVVAATSSTTTREKSNQSYRGRMLFDPELGYAAVYRVSQIRFDDIGPKWHDFASYELHDYKQSGDIYLPGTATYTSLSPTQEAARNKKPSLVSWQHQIQFEEWELNPTFTDDDFKVTIPDGVFVMDETR